MQLAMIQDKIVPFADLESVYLDRGTYFGDGVYEVVRSYNGRIFALDEHIERFGRSLGKIDIQGVDVEKIRTRVELAFETAKIANAKIYFHITRGQEQREHVGSSELEPNFFLTITDLPDDPDISSGIAVSSHPDWRWKRCDIKSLNLLANVLARRDAESKGCKEAILVDDKGMITEGAGSAFFAINAAKRELITHPLGPEILGSITRGIAIQIAPQAGLTVVEKAITPSQAQSSDELFTAVTTRGIVAVVKFDGETIGDGKVGVYTNKLIEALQREIEKSI